MFLSLTALGAFLEVVADQLDTRGAPAALAADPAHPTAAATRAVSLVAVTVSIYLLSVWWMGTQVTGAKVRPHAIWAASLALLAAVVFAVWLGLPLPWAIPAITVAPAFVIVMVERNIAKRAKNA